MRKKTDARGGTGDTFRDQGKLRPLCGAVHHHEFHTIADGPDRVDKIVADARSDQGAEVWTFGHVPS